MGGDKKQENAKRALQKGMILIKKITPAKEDYLKTLWELSRKDSVINSIDIANSLSISKASVSRMMNVLKDEGYINKEKYGTITLTQKGKQEAYFVKRRHKLLKNFLTEILGVEDKIADEDACRMEHVVSIETLKILNKKIDEI